MSGGFSHTDIIGAIGKPGDLRAGASRLGGKIRGGGILHRGIDAGNFTVVVAAVCAGNGSHAGSRRAVRLDNSGSSSAGDLTSLNIAGDLHGDGLADVVCAQRVLAGVVGRNLCCAVLIPLVVQIAGVVATGQRGGQILAILQGAGDACRAGEGSGLEGRLDAHILTGHGKLAVRTDGQAGGSLVIPFIKDIAAVGGGRQGDFRACRSSCGACAGRAVAVVLNGHGVGRRCGRCVIAAGVGGGAGVRGGHQALFAGHLCCRASAHSVQDIELGRVGVVRQIDAVNVVCRERTLHHRGIALGDIRDAQGVAVEHSGGVSGLARHTEHDLVNIKPVSAGLCIGRFVYYRINVCVICINCRSVSFFIHSLIRYCIFDGGIIPIHKPNKGLLYNCRGIF